MKILLTAFIFVISLSAHANLTGKYFSEFDRGDWHCMVQIDLNHQNLNSLTFNQWDEYCETDKGDEYSKTTDPGLSIKKIDDNHIEWSDSTGKVVVETEVANFDENNLHIKFPFEDEDGSWNLEMKLELSGSILKYYEGYTLNGEVVYENEGEVSK